MSRGALPEDRGAVDPAGMLETVLDAPGQWDRALDIAADLPVDLVPDVRGVVVAGMGGSGIAGDLAAAIAAERGRAPVVARRDYRLPVWVGPDTLVVVVSHSGDTAESVAAADHALAVGAPLVAVTSGGRLASLAEGSARAVVRVPGDLQPRASLAYLLVPVLVVLERAGVLDDVGRDLGLVAGHLAPLVERWRPDGGPEGRERGAPLEVAGRLHDATPWFLGSQGLPAVVAERARCQVNENAERLAHASELPEADHNAVVGWAGGGPRPPLVLVELRDPGEDPRVARRFAATREVSGGCFRDIVTHRLEGPTAVTRLAAGILFVDLVSVCLALTTGVDPTPVVAITSLKQRLEGPG